MKIVQVVPSIQYEASGPSYAVPRLCEALADMGAEVSLHVVGGFCDHGHGYRIRAHPPVPFLPRLGISPDMQRALAASARTADIMHNHSLWMMPNVYPSWAVYGKKCRLVCSPRGTLSARSLERNWLLKKVMWVLGQRAVVEQAACIHVTGESEYTAVRRLKFRAPIAVIPNGIDLPTLAATASRPAGRLRRLLFLGRIHPIKGVDILLRAWQEVAAQASDWQLCIIGPDEGGYSRELQNLAYELRLERVSFFGSVFGGAKTAAFREADLFVLPSHTENFGVAVAEALAHGVPAIVSRGAPWAGLEEQQCGWWVEIGVGPLVQCLRHALRLPPEGLQAMGQRGRSWMERDFSWAMVGNMMHATYQWLLGGGTAPGWVRRTA